MLHTRNDWHFGTLPTVVLSVIRKLGAMLYILITGVDSRLKEGKHGMWGPVT